MFYIVVHVEVFLASPYRFFFRQVFWVQDVWGEHAERKPVAPDAGGPATRGASVGILEEESRIGTVFPHL